MGAIIAWFRDSPQSPPESEVGQEQAVRPDSQQMEPEPQPVVTNGAEQAAGPAAPGPGDVPPTSIDHTLLPDSDYRYLTDKDCDCMPFQLCQDQHDKAEVRDSMAAFGRSFTSALQSRMEVDIYSKQLRDLVGRPHDAALPACFSVWADTAFPSLKAKEHQIRIVHDEFHHRQVISVLVIDSNSGEVQLINECVKKVISSCRTCVEKVASAVTAIRAEQANLGRTPRPTQACMAAMKDADELCRRLQRFSVEAFSLLNNINVAAMDTLQLRASKQVTGLHVLVRRV